MAEMMKKTFTVQSVKNNSISNGKGALVWQLSDELDRPRKVTGVTTLDKQGRILSTRAVYERETPLVERLLQQNEGDTFSIDFGPINAALDYQKREVYTNMRKIQQIGRLGDWVTQLLWALIVLVSCWLIWVLFDSVSHFIHFPASNHELP